MEAAFCQEVSQQEVTYEARENEPSAAIGPLLQNAKADWLWHNHKKKPIADGLSSSTQTQARSGMKMTISLFKFTLIFA